MACYNLIKALKCKEAAQLEDLERVSELGLWE